MSNKVSDITYRLADDCDTLLCKLESAAYEAWNEARFGMQEVYENDAAQLEDAIKHHDTKRMQTMLEKYHAWFKRYR